MKTQQLENLLPQDGEVYFYGCILSQEEADYYFLRLLTAIAWKPDEAIILVKHLFTKRKIGLSPYTAVKFCNRN